MDARDEKATGTGAPPPIPFDRELLDALLERAGIDVLVVVGASIAIAVLATVYPSRTAAGLTPVEAIRHE